MKDMSYLMRMISPMQEWSQESEEVTSNSLISADAISDLKTTDNSISTWYVNNCSEDDIRKGILALASGFRSLDMIKVAFLDYERISAGFSVENTDGETKIKEYAGLHRDISMLNAGTLQSLAKLILESVWSENIRVIHKEELTVWMLQALNEEKLDFDALDKNMRMALAASINKMVKKNKITKDDIRKEVWDDIERQVNINKKKTNCKFEIDCERYKKAS